MPTYVAVNAAAECRTFGSLEVTFFSRAARTHSSSGSRKNSGVEGSDLIFRYVRIQQAFHRLTVKIGRRFVDHFHTNTLTVLQSQ